MKIYCQLLQNTLGLAVAELQKSLWVIIGELHNVGNLAVLSGSFLSLLVHLFTHVLFQMCSRYS